MGPNQSPQVHAGRPSTPTHSCDGSDSSQVRRSPRCKDARTPYYLPLSEQPVNVSSPARNVGLPDSCSPNAAARKGSRTASAPKRSRGETHEASFRCPPLPSRTRPGAQQQEAGNLHGGDVGERGVPAQADQSLVIVIPESPAERVQASHGQSAPRGVSMSPSRSLANQSCSESDSGAVGSQSTGGRQRRATAAAAMLRIKGKMKPPSALQQYSNLTAKEALATVSAAVSAAHTHSQQPSQGVKDEPSCATSRSARAKPAVSARATRSTTTAQAPSTSKSTSGRKRRLPAVADDSVSTEPDLKRLAKQGGAPSGCNSDEDVDGKAQAAGPAVSTAKAQSSMGLRQGPIKREPAQAQPGKQRGGAARKERSAKELVEAVAKGADSSTAAPPQRGRAAVKLKQEDARAAAAKGKLLPAAVPAMQASAMPASAAADVKREPPAPVEDMFPCGAVPWTDAEVARLHYVCTHKVPPSSLRYWQQVALHMPGRAITECYEKFNERHSAPKRRGRTAAAPRAAAAPAMKSLGGAEPKTECQKRKYVRQVRWQMQSSQVQNDPDRLAELMRQQKATDACIDALKRRRPNVKPKPIVGTLSKPPPEFPVFAGLDDDDTTQADPGPGSVTPKVRAKPRQSSQLPDISEALEVMQRGRQQLLESPDADYYFSDGCDSD